MRARIIIVGGGFAGAATAIHLLRKTEQPLDITILEPRDSLGAGLAYSTNDLAHRINVPSDKMIVLADEPRAFTDWLEETGRRAADPAGETDAGFHYSRRIDFGEFMADLLARAVSDSNPGSTVTHLRERAVHVAPRSGQVTVGLASGCVIAAEKVVLAMSHARPASPVLTGPDVAAHPGFHADPWDSTSIAAIAPDAKVMVLGTGLTMVDVVSGLLERGHRGQICAVSRRGLLPRGHATFGPVDVLPKERLPETALAGLRLARSLVSEHLRANRDWQLAIECLRASAPSIWRGWTVSEQRRALGKFRAYWDVHRFRIAPQLAKRIATAHDTGQLIIQRAGCAGLSSDGNQLCVDLRQRNRILSEKVDAVVLCTGPNGDITRRDDPLLYALFATGEGRPDPHLLGLDVDCSLRVRSRTGEAQPAVHAVGPLTRGVEWEVVGVPELSGQADRLAGILVSDLAQRGPIRSGVAGSDVKHEDMGTS